MENLEKAISEIKRQLPQLELFENENMSGHCSFKIGGPVRALACPENQEQLMTLCRILYENSTAPYILGNGTNILFPDEGLRDLFIISTEKLDSVRLTEDGDIYAEAGLSLARLASFAQQKGLAGLEFASGIPGSLGGGVLMDAGAYGGEMKDVVKSVTFLYLPQQKIYTVPAEKCSFCYRNSFFKRLGNCIILSAVFRLRKGDCGEIAAAMRELNERRRAKQPLDLPSAGSTFKRPEGYYAAALIDEAGLRGYSVGGAQVSEKHTGFVVNKGGAKASDVRELMRRIQKKVSENSGIELEAEVIVLRPDCCPEFRKDTDGSTLEKLYGQKG